MIFGDKEKVRRAIRRSISATKAMERRSFAMNARESRGWQGRTLERDGGGRAAERTERNERGEGCRGGGRAREDSGNREGRR